METGSMTSNEPAKWNGKRVSLKGREYRFKLTCSAYPEQYDVFVGDVQVAYFRLRNHYFSVECPDCGVITFAQYQAETIGYGEFEDSEREPQMMAALDRVSVWLEANPDHLQSGGVLQKLPVNLIRENGGGYGFVIIENDQKKWTWRSTVGAFLENPDHQAGTFLIDGGWGGPPGPIHVRWNGELWEFGGYCGVNFKVEPNTST